MTRFKDKIILISGGATGIGLGVAQRFVEEGAKVVLMARRTDKLKDAVKALGKNAAHVVGDVCKPADCARTVAETVRLHGRIDVLVNAAGVIGSGGVQNVTAAEFDRVMQPNVYGLLYLSQATTPELVKTSGNIVNLSSVTGTRPYANLIAYCASKAAVTMMTQCMALDLAPQGVRVNAVEPGVVRSELHRVTNAVPDYAAFLERSKTTHPLGRHGEPADVAGAIAFLASSDASWITGECMKVDGGRFMTSLR
ncbi:MAG: glucose 1-dehydrogenase [Planctomycetes bacterium]|nr:glucose 1-dehydrogenase [Planctomycetota bacterium]